MIALVASTAIATAAPKLDVSQPSRAAIEPKQSESGGRVYLGDRKPRPPPKAPVIIDGWTEITDATPSKFGTVFVTIGRAATPFARIRFVAVSGTVRLRNVKVHFADGTSKTFAITKSLSAKRQMSSVIDLDGPKRVIQLDITTDRRPAGEYSIYGAPQLAPDKSTCC